MKSTHNVIAVSCDPNYYKSVRVTCRCGHEWTEDFPLEIYDAQHMAPVVECIMCHQEYMLYLKKWRRMDSNDNERTLINNARRQTYDA